MKAAKKIREVVKPRKQHFFSCNHGTTGNVAPRKLEDDRETGLEDTRGSFMGSLEPLSLPRKPNCWRIPVH